MASSSPTPALNLHDNVSRVKRSTPGGTALFIGLRATDVVLQYSLLAFQTASPLLHALGIPTLPTPIIDSSAPIWTGILSLPLKSRLLLSFALGSWLKQTFWVISVAETEIRVGDAIGISIFNTLFNSLNTIGSTIAPLVALFLPSAANSLLGRLGIVSPTQPDQNTLSPVFLLGTAMCVTGLVVETVSELQRRDFKKQPKNKGKAFTGGLFSLARHINYGAYTLWRSGYALAAGGPVWGALMFWFFFADFANRGVPVLDAYCTKRYGEQWQLYKTKTRSVLIPGVY